MSTDQRAPIAFCDTETDGVHPGRKAWEVAIVRREPDGTEEAWEAMLEIDLATADPFGLRIGGYYDRHPVGRTVAGHDRHVASSLDWPAAAAHQIARLTHGAHIVGAVPSFDTDVLDRLLRGEGYLPAWHYHLVDAENLAVGYLAGQGRPLLPPWSSDDLTAALGLEPTSEEERHTAMGDVRWAMRLWDRIMGGEYVVDDPADVADLMRDPE